MFGRHPLVAKYVPILDMTSAANLATFNVEMRDAIKAAIQAIQQHLHAADIGRARHVTLADLKRISLEVGVEQFRKARIGAKDDSAALMDLTEIFGQDDEFATALKWESVGTKKGLKAPLFRGRA